MNILKYKVLSSVIIPFLVIYSIVIGFFCVDQGDYDFINFNRAGFCGFEAGSVAVLLEITMPTNHIYTSGDSYRTTVTAKDSAGNVLTNYDGQFDLTISSGTITPTTARIPKGSNGIAQVDVTISGAVSSYTIVAKESSTASQPADVDCFGGAEAAPDSSGGGGGGDAVLAEPVLTCTLTGPATEVLINTNYSMTLTVVKQDQFGTSFSTFSGKANLSSSIPSISPVTQNLTRNGANSWNNFKLTGVGANVVTANITDDADASLTATCMATVNTISPIAVLAEPSYVDDLISKLSALTPAKKFSKITDVNTLDAYSGLIVNYAGLGWGTDGNELSEANALKVKSFYDAKKPVIIAHDQINASVLTSLITPIWGVTSATNYKLTADVFTPNTGSGHAILNSITAITHIPEIWTSGFLHSAGPVEIVTTVDSSAVPSAITYSLILATGSGTKGVLLGEALFHPYGGQNAPDEQWIETNPVLVTNILNWVFP